MTNMTAVLTRRRVLLASAVLLAGTALFFALRKAPQKTPAAGPAAAARPSAEPVPPAAQPPEFTPPVRLPDAAGMSTADIAIALAGWPQKNHPDLPKWAALLAARGPAAVNDLSSALATAGSNAARGVLSDALARIGTDDAIQNLCLEAVKVPDGAPRQAIASSFRALSRPQAVPMLATLFSETDSAPLVTEASDAIRRLADGAGVEALADRCQEGGVLYSQRETIFRILTTLENPEALPALEVLAADSTDTARADAAREGVAYLKAATAARQKGR